MKSKIVYVKGSLRKGSCRVPVPLDSVDKDEQDRERHLLQNDEV